MPNDTGESAFRRDTLWLILLVAVWALELTIVQEYTTRPSTILPALVVIKYAARRMIFDISACVVLTWLLNRFWLYVVFAAAFIWSNGVVLYANYFGVPLSWPTILSQWREGEAVADHVLTLVQWPVLLALGLALAAKMLLREVAARRQIEKPRRKVAAMAAVVCLGYAIVFAGIYKPIGKIKFGTPMYVYGYAVGWAAQAALYDEDKLLELAVEASKEKSQWAEEQTTPLDIPEHLAIVQVESLDFGAIDSRWHDQWVMPFLHDLKSRSMFYKVQPVHETGTADADFTLLTGSMPNGRVAPYKIHRFPYTHTLPKLAAKLGYECVGLHGYAGAFFDRRPAYARMGFDRVYFAEELKTLGCQATVDGVADADVFDVSARWMAEATHPTMHFIITFTSHGPFNRLPEEAPRLIESPASTAEAYLDSMRYVDRSLEDYVAKLPDGSTIVLYGDHASGVRGYRDPLGSREKYIPWLIYRKGQDLAARQAPESRQTAMSGKLRMLDMASYVHRSMEKALVASRRNPAASGATARR